VARIPGWQLLSQSVQDRESVGSVAYCPGISHRTHFFLLIVLRTLETSLSFGSSWEQL